MNEYYRTVQAWCAQDPLTSQLVMALVVVTFALVSYWIMKRVLVRLVSKAVSMTKTNLDDLLLRKEMLPRLAFMAPLIILYSFSDAFGPAQGLVSRVCGVFMVWFLMLTINSLLSGAHELYLTLEISRGRPIKGLVQLIKLALFIVGTIIILGVLLGRSPLVLLSGFGALTAVIILIFKDTILSLVASLQITSGDMVRVGDWIEVPSAGADGDVVDIALHTVTVRNFDKTFTYIPTYKLVDGTFKNWRGMSLSGVRRIKRSLLIDMESVRFVDDALMARLEQVELLRDYIKDRKRLIQDSNQEKGVDTSMPVNGRRMTNLGTFRAYLEAYLKDNENIHSEMTFMVRQLAPTPNGIPLEMYIFSKVQAWIQYEGIQADIFDHILAVVPEFGLRVFQNPRGDFSAWPGREKTQG